MSRMIYVNLPVADLAKSRAFYEAAGFTPEPKFSNEMAACMVWSETIYAMLLSHDFWKTFTTKAIPDAHYSAQVLLCLTCDSRADVDAMVDAAAASGGKADPCPVQDMGVMYGRSIEDPDGHIWETTWMDQNAFADGPPV